MPDLARGARQHQLPPMSSGTGGPGLPPYGPSHYGSPTDYRPLLTRGHPATVSPTRATRPLEPNFPNPVSTGPSSYSLFTSHPRPEMTSIHRAEPAVAYLQLEDLKILRTTASFGRALATNPASLLGRTMFDLVMTQHHGTVDRLQKSLHEERVAREPAYIPPPYLGAVTDWVNRVREGELGELIQGSQEWLQKLTLVLPDGRQRTLRTAFRLVRVSVFFVIMFILHDVPPTPPRQGSPTSSRPPGFPTLPMPSPSLGYGGPLLASPFAEQPRSGLSPGGRSEPAPSPRLLGRSFDDPGGRAFESPTMPAQPSLLNPLLLDTRSSTGVSSSSPEIPRPPSLAGPPVTRRRSEPQPPSRRPADEYQMGLQLPPIRSPAERPPASGETGRKRSEKESEEEEASAEAGRPEGRKRKRQRVSVEEIVE